MKFASIYAEGYSNNRLFAEKDPTQTYAPTYTSRLLRNTFLQAGIELNTPDLNLGKEQIFELYVEGQVLQENSLPKYLVAAENPHINPLNSNIEYCSNFRKVFTWNPKIASLHNGILVMTPNQIVTKSVPPYSDRYLLLSLVNANKRFPKQLDDDLYQERIKHIRWYEANHPESFALYGRGWDKPRPAFTFSEKLARRFYRLRTQIYGYRPFPSYRGPVNSKFEGYGHARFGICYENSKDMPNYITEKIFDCMMEGCVPVYWGANNILDFIPPECFIDRRDFKTFDDLHNFLLSINRARFDQYQDAISQFLMSTQIEPFKASYFVDVIFTNIMNDLGKL